MAIGAQLDQPIFVVGAPRSGTTLVQSILSASSVTFSLPETHFFSMLLPGLGCAPEQPLSRWHLEGARGILEREARFRFDVTVWQRLEATADDQQVCARDLFVWLVDQHRPPADAERTLRVIEKTPLHVAHLDQIGSVFTDAAFVNVIRDPIDTVSSWLEAPFASSRAVLGYARAWTEAILAAERYAQHNPRRIISIQYEHLVRAPEHTVQQLCQFLGLPYEVGMLERFGEEAARNIAPRETWKDDVLRGVLIDQAGIWRTRITPGQAWLIGQRTTAVASRYGYRSPQAKPGSIAAALGKEVCERFAEARRSGDGVISAARHAGATFKLVWPRRAGA